ncbi:amidohydrolase [Guggenheimella bovis]
MIIRGANVLTMVEDKENYQKVDVQVKDGKIVAIGNVTADDEIIDAEGALLLPGFIDAHTHLGMWEDSIGFEGSDGNEMTNPITPELRAIDAINPMDRNFSEALQGGVTCVSSGPGSANVMGGAFCILKTFGHRIDDMLVRTPSAMKIAFGENPKRIYSSKNASPSTRMGTAAELRNVLFKAKDYYEKKQKPDPKDHPNFDFKLESLIPVFEKKIPLKAHAHRADDIFTAIRIAKEFDLKITLDHVTEGHLIADDLSKENLPCIVGPSFGERSKVELKNKCYETAGELQRKGVLVAIMTDHPVIPLEHLNMTASYCVRDGMDHYEALKAITINPAKILEIEDRVGSIEVGKDADLVLWSGDPLDIRSRVLLTLVDGRIAYKK